MSTEHRIILAIRACLQYHPPGTHGHWQMLCVLGSYGDTLSAGDALDYLEDIANRGTVYVGPVQAIPEEGAGRNNG